MDIIPEPKPKKQKKLKKQKEIKTSPSLINITVGKFYISI